MSRLVQAIGHRSGSLVLAHHGCVRAASHAAANVRRGNIQVIFGPMFSGKTTELLRRIRRFNFAKQQCLLLKYSKDTRFGLSGVATHDRQTSDARVCSSLSQMREQALAADVIGIDEGQFFPDIVPFCEEMANAGKTVIVAALDGTFQRKVLGLVPLAESIVKLNAVCMYCYQDAAFSKRLGSETEVEVIGGAEKYAAVCRSCYNSIEATTTPSPP